MVVGAPIMLAAVHAGGVWWLATLVIIAAWGSLELGDLFVAKGAVQPHRDVLVLAGLLGVLMPVAVRALEGTRWAWLPLVSPAVVLAYGALRAWARGASLLLEASAATFAFSYVGVLTGVWWLLREQAGQGLPFTMLALTGTWATDIGAFVTGKAMGRHRLLPRVSPSKTWEGALGGFVVGCLTVTLLGWRAFAMPASLGLGLGAVTAASAELGDLAESALKRDANVKDSGWLLPGHGGILDRMDSVLTAGLAAYVFLVFAARP